MARLSTGLIAGLLLLVFSTAPVQQGSAEPISGGGFVVDFRGSVAPRALPRTQERPVAVSFEARVLSSEKRPPTLRRMTIDLSRHGRIDRHGLPTCAYSRLESTTSGEALRACRPALIGRGRVTASVALPEQSPFPSSGRMLLFNAQTNRGKPALLGHVYGQEPIPVTTVVRFRIVDAPGGWGRRLDARLPVIAADWGYVERLEVEFARRFSTDGKRRSYLSAACPAPRGLKRALFSLARGHFTFADGSSLSGRLDRVCRVED